jgi:hypothetical protein
MHAESPDIFELHEHLGYAADDPRIGYCLNTIGNDRDIFEHDYWPGQCPCCLFSSPDYFGRRTRDGA